MAGKKPLKISDDVNDLQPEEFDDGDQAEVDGLINPNNDLTFEDNNAGGPHTLFDLVNWGLGVAGIKVSFLESGTVNDKWLKVQAGVSEPSGPASDDSSVPFITPFASEIVGYAFTNRSVGADFNAEIYVNGVLTRTFAITNRKWEVNTNFTPIVLAAGDQVSVFSRTNTQATNTPRLDFILKFTDSTQQLIGNSTL